jgi:hypothetical protein
MATNQFFNKFAFVPEQEFLEDLIVEAIQIYGHDILYIPRNVVKFDQIYETDDQSDYNTTIPVEVFIENIDGFQGDQDIFTKFGLEIRDNIVLSIASRTFKRIVQPVTNQPRPMEGDIIYFPLNKKCFQIKFVNNKEIFYPLGSLPSYRLTLDLFEYSDETFNTGIPEIDSIQNNLSLNVLDYAILLPNGQYLTDTNGNIIIQETLNIATIDPVDDNADLNVEDKNIVDWSENNPFGSITQD